MWEGVAQGTEHYGQEPVHCRQRSKGSGVTRSYTPGFYLHGMGASLGPPPGRAIYEFIVMVK